MSTIAATWTSFMDDHWPMCSRPRPFTPQTAMRSISLGPARRSVAALAGIAAAAAAITERPRKSRRFSMLMDPPGLDVFGNRKRLAILAGQQLVRLVVTGDSLGLAVEAHRASDAQGHLGATAAA